LKFDDDVADPRSLYWTRGSERHGPFSPDEFANEMNGLGLSRVSITIESPLGSRWVLLSADGNKDSWTAEKLVSMGIISKESKS
jgi:hypothetical protein